MNLRYRKTEIIILSLYLVLLSMATIKMQDFELQGVAFLFVWGLFAYIFFIIDHKIQFLLDKDNNKFTIVEKALFRNEHRVLKQLKLDEIQEAYVYTSISHNREEGTSTTYALHIKTKNQGTINPFNSSTSCNNAYEKIANQINEFLTGNENTKIIEHKPFIFRIFGIIFSLIYINLCLIIISPEFAEKIIPMILEAAGWKKG